MENPKRFDLSIKRLFFRFLLTFILGIIFGLAMIPFLQTADNLYDMQQSAIGQQNLIRMVVLWGLFTALFSALSFWKKRFRMTAILLILCWLISIVLLIFILVRDSADNEISCTRSEMYATNQEINRAMDHIKQRLNITDEVNSPISLAFQFRNCINIQYTDDPNIVNSAEGVFLQDDPTLQNLKVLIDSSYSKYDDLSLALLLVHEINHAGQYINSINTNNANKCFDEETDSFLVQDIFFSLLTDEERRSIYTRLNDDPNKNPAISVILMFEDINSQILQSCKNIQTTNALTDVQLNECAWQGVRNRLDQEIRNIDYYKEQCTTLN